MHEITQILAQATEYAATITATAAAAGTTDYGPLPALFFYFFAAVIVGGALATALARSIVRAAVGLLAALTGVAGMYLLLGAEFLAAAQLVVYVGGTLILMIFGIMLTSKAVGGGVTPRRSEAVAGAVTAGLLAVGLGWVFLHVEWHTGNAVGREFAAASQPTVQDLGRALLAPHGYLMPFELLSFLLLAVMIGAAYLAKSRRTRPAASGGSVGNGARVTNGGTGGQVAHGGGAGTGGGGAAAGKGSA